MLISYPVLPTDSADHAEHQRFDAMLAFCQHDRGLYPVTTGNRWHGGIHLSPGDAPIRAIADGVIVAYRLAPDTKDYPGQGAYDTSFVLIRHETDSGENTRVVFYSLYMHLQPKGLLSNAQRQQLMSFLRDAAPSDAAVAAPTNTRVWRKEVLGFAGRLYGQPTVHFEIFATDGEFNAFWRDRNAIAAGDHGSDDVFGNSYFIIPAGRDFVARHPRATAPHRIEFPGRDQFYALPEGQAGQNAARLLVVNRLDRGRRVATTFRLDDQGRVAGEVGAAVTQDDYEYELYRLATALYPDCPSAGFEYLRFGRILGSDTTTRVENWQLVRYSDTGVGYINLADPAHQVSVLSDADFPMLWQRLEEGQAASPSDGIANIARLTELLQLPAEPAGAPLFAPPDFAARARDANVAAALRHLTCKHPSEWDAGDLDTRYAPLRQPGKPLYGDAAWNAFREHVEAMAFWPQAGVPERSVWHFHPLQFIRHYRRCGWLSQSELAQCMPRQNYHLVGSAFRQQLVATWRTAQTRSARWSEHLNVSARKYIVPATKQRLVHFLSQVIEESGYLQFVVEGGGQDASYAPWYGRGLIQLTHLANYQEYGRFKGWSGEAGINQAYAQLGWNPDQRIAQSDFACADTAGFYWTCPTINAIGRHMNRPADNGIDASDILAVSRGVNGNVAVERVNGLDIRIQLAVFLKHVLMDHTPPSGNNPVEAISFTWRNQSRRPYTAVQHILDVILTPQRP